MIIRKVDELGRIVIPKEMRDELKINIRDKVEIENEGSEIILRKHEEKCIFCNKKTTETFKNKKVCKDCLEEIKECLKIGW